MMRNQPLPDDGPPPGGIPITDPALDPYDLNGDGYLDADEQAAAMDDPFLSLHSSSYWRHASIMAKE